MFSWLETSRACAAFAILVVSGGGCTGSQTSPDPAPTSAPSSKPGSQPGSSPASAPGGVKLEEALLEKGEPLKGGAAITAVDMQVDVRFLADDAREGRGIGTKGLEDAGEYIAKRFGEVGLTPAGDGGTFFQSFEVTVGAQLDDPAQQAFSMGSSAPLKLGDAWRPFAFSDNGAAEAEVVFAGYGISAPDLDYDDYAGLDVKGKIVLVMRHEPGRRDKDSKFNGDKPSRHSDLRYKAHVAKRKGAVGLIVVNDPASYAKPTKDEADDLYVFRGSAQAGILAIHVTHKGGASVFGASLGLDLAALQKAIDEKGSPASKATGKKASLKVAITRRKASVRNVVGVLTPEKDADVLLDRHGAIVVGAHYDHLGKGGSSSLRPGSDDIHNGADDNASGTSLVMELAQALSAQRATLKRRVYFVAFTAEEVGLRGSQHFADNLPVEASKIAAMMNFDMVGRLREGKLTVGGIGTAREFESLVKKAGEGTGLTLNLNRDGFGPSDHSSFYAKKIPVLFMFTGAHDAYHTPDDDIDTVNFEGMEIIGGFAHRLLVYLTRSQDRPFYVQADVKAVGDSGGSGGRGYGRASLGTVPSFDDTGGKGVKLQGVRAGSAAEAAGIKPGDILVGMGDTEIKDLYDFTYALREHKPGDKVKVVVMRDGQRMELRATLGARSEKKK